MSNYTSPCNMLYFHGKLTRDQAEDLLMSQGAIEGMFLLRESVYGNYVVSICHNNNVNHYNIEKKANNSYQILTGRKFNSPVELMEHHMLHLDGFLTLLRIPLERYPSGTSYYVLQGLKSSLLEECLERKAIEMGLKDKGTIHEALNGPMRNHLQYLVLKDMHECQPWFHHMIRRLDAERRLEEAGYTEGQYLVRERKEDTGFVLSLSYQNQAKHYRINVKFDKLQIDGGQHFDTLIELIDHYHFRQDGLLCKLRFAVECPGYIRSKMDRSQCSSDFYFEGCHTSVCTMHPDAPHDHSFNTRTLPKLHINQSKDACCELSIDHANNSTDLINFYEWSTNLTKLLNNQSISATSIPNSDACLAILSDQTNKSGNVFQLIKNNITSPQIILNSVKEMLHLTKNCNHKDYLINSKIDDRDLKFDIQKKLFSLPDSDQQSQVTVTIPEKDNVIGKSKSSSMPIKLQQSDLSLLDPLYSEKTQTFDYDHSFNLSIDRLDIKHKLGCGNFGYVYSGFYKLNQSVSMPVAIKMLKKEVHAFAATQDILSEAATMAKLTHKHIVRLIGVCRSDELLLVLELAPLGPINKFLRQNIHTPIWNLVELMNQVAKGMAFLEAFKFVHRDLAARNVLLVNLNYAKISDFGMSKALNYGHEYYKAATAGKWPLKWYAPECIYYFRFDSKSDVWSYGITLWEVFSYGEKPYKDLKGTEILAMLENGQRLKRPVRCPTYIYDLMLHCWSMTGKHRPNFTEIVSTMTNLAANSCNSFSDLLVHTSYQATSSGSSVAKTSYGSSDCSHFPAQPDYNTEIETWSKVSLSDDNNDIVIW